ncbi:MAG TPA: carboxypeptidase regulatory-like domain-containing protein [Candidatus Dormibacteraeota bacterium]|nr:carboxypeptidase regulatory-like domain-containing protein [Candidatus Dormibacteraeota bacterium]
MRRFLGNIAAILLFVISFAANFAYGQGGATGAINGTVTDTSGASIAGAEVQIINAGTDSLVRKVATGDDGEFVVTLLPPGLYHVVVNMAGFSEARASNIEVRVTETTKLSIGLKPGQVSEKIEISAEVTSVETSNATTGQTIGSQTIRDLPLATQNYQQLLTLSTGAQSDLNAAAQLGRGVVRIFVNGQREDNNNYLIDGISATDYNVAQSFYVPLPNPDVVQEFRVQTSLYDASQGRNSGGNVNAILKSGGKGLHGDVYEFFRNDVLNANEYFLNANRQKRPPVKQNIFGGSLGGPVGTEKFGFFFVNYQGTRQRSALSPGTGVSNAALPVLPTQRDAATLAAAFSTASFPITANMIDPVVLKLLSAKGNLFGDANGFLLPSVPGATADLTLGKTSYKTATYVFSRPGKYTDDQFTTNWDREFRGGQDKVGVRFFFSDSESYLPYGAGGLQASLGGTLASSVSSSDLNFPYDIPVAARFFTVSETHLFSTSLVNDFRFGLVHINDSLINVNPITVADLGIDRPTNNVTKSIYKFTLNGSSGFQFGPTPPADQFQNQNNYNFVETLSWVKASHIWKFGGDYTRINLDKLFPQTFNGQLFFSDTPGGATDWQNFLIGQPAASFGGGGVFNHKYRGNDIGLFAQDDWKIRKRLTLNLGLRVELNGAFKDNLCHIGNIDENLSAQGKYPFVYGGCANSLKLAGLTGAGSNTTYFNDYATNLAPRIGFAYDLGGTHDTTVRGGYGIYYVREDVGTVDQLSFQAPFLPIAGGGSPAGCLAAFFSPNPQPAGCPSPNPNALPIGGFLDPNFVPCQSEFQGFPLNDSTQAAQYGCAPGSPGLVPSTNLFVLAVPRHFVSPSTQQWNLTVQRDLGKLWVLEVGYVGTHSVHLRETRTDIPSRFASVANPIFAAGDTTKSVPIVYNTLFNGPARSPVQGINGFSLFQIFASDAYSHYHSLQTTLSRRWGRGYFQGAYTWSKSTDATSTGNTAFNTAFNDESNLKNSRGLSDFDRTHRLAVSYRYELPFFASAQGWKHAVLSGWEVSGITILQSGNPFTVTDSNAGTAFIGPGIVTTLTGSLAPGATIASGYSSGDVHNRLVNYLNPNNFVPASFLYPNDPANQATTCNPGNSNFCTTYFGTLGRNTYRGPRQQNWDFSLLKNMRLTERQNLRFAADFFNTWNHANFANPSQASLNVQNPKGSFALINQTVGTPRLIQLSLRYSF